MMEKDARKLAMRVSGVSIAVNLLLSVFKFMAGWLASSKAMISDAIHSASDVFSTLIVIIGVNISAKKADAEHPYGHERMECVASILLAVVLAVTGAGIGYGGMMKIAAGNYETLQPPGILALAAAVISIVVKEWMYWYTRGAARRIRSGALMADAWHHRSDALSSVGAFIGILGSRMGFPVLDSVASVVICLFILKASVDIFKDAVDKMVDKSCESGLVEQIRQQALIEKGVESVDEMRTRMFGSRVYVDIEIGVNGEMKLSDAHRIAENVHRAVEESFDEVKHCMVHVNPSDEEQEKRYK